MLRITTIPAVFAISISMALTAFAQSPARKTRTALETDGAVKAYNLKITTCQAQAREQHLHLFKKRRFIRDCVGKD